MEYETNIPNGSMSQKMSMFFFQRGKEWRIDKKGSYFTFNDRFLDLFSSHGGRQPL